MWLFKFRFLSQGAEECNSTEIPVKFTVSMHRRSILLFKVNAYHAIVLRVHVIGESRISTEDTNGALNITCLRRRRFCGRLSESEGGRAAKTGGEHKNASYIG